VLEQSGYRDALKQERAPETEARLENLEELIAAAEDYTHSEAEPTLEGFLDGVALMSDVDELKEAEARVTLMTLHSAKGLEFETVFIVGVEEDLCPHLRAAENEADLEEERRLLYVGMTRARQRLILSRAGTRFQFGQARTTEPSRFLQEIPATLLRVQAEEAVERWARSARPVRRFERFAAAAPPRSGAFWTPDADAAEAPAPPSLYSLGCKVHHAEYGVGTVIGIEGTGDQQKVTVSFSIVGSKKFLPRFARLERL